MSKTQELSNTPRDSDEPPRTALVRTPSPGHPIVLAQLSAVAEDAERALEPIRQDAAAALARAQQELDIATTRMADATAAHNNAISARAGRTFGPAMREKLRTANPAVCVSCGEPIKRKPRPARRKSGKSLTRSRPLRDDLLEDDKDRVRGGVCSPKCAGEFIADYEEQVRASTLRELRCEEALAEAERDFLAARTAVADAKARLKLLSELRSPGE